MLAEEAASKRQDAIFRLYPFVLAKAIFLGFKCLCPGDQTIFKGAFPRILNTSIFHLMTGIENCINTTNAIRLRLYPRDSFENGCPNLNYIMKPSDRGFDPLITQQQPQPQPQPQQRHRRAAINGFLTKINTDQSEPTLFSPMKYKEHRDKEDTMLCSRPPRIKYDAYLLSPLLQNHLGRQNVLNGCHHYITRVEPSSKSKTGGVETYHSRFQNNEHHSSSRTESSATFSFDSDEVMKRYRRSVQDLKKDLKHSEVKSGEQLKGLEDMREEVLKGGKRRIKSFAESIIS